MIKTFFFICLQALWLLAALPGHGEVLTGTVVVVDRDRQEIILDIASNQDKPQQVVIHSAVALPSCARTGNTIRAWGRFIKGKTIKFSATDIRGPGRHTDATGVLSRLHRQHQSSSSHLTRKTSPPIRHRGRRHRRR